MRADFSCVSFNAAASAGAGQAFGLQPTVVIAASNKALSTTIPCVRILIDSGSNVSLITRALALKLQLEGTMVKFRLNVASGEQVESFEKLVTVRFANKVTNIFSNTEFAVYTIKTIGKCLPPISFDPRDFQHLRDLVFTDKYPSDGTRAIDVLLGEPYASQLLSGQLLAGRIGEPAAVITEFGPALCGAFDAVVSPFSAFANASEIHGLEIWKKMWDLSNLGITDVAATEAGALRECDARALDLMKNCSVYDSSRRRWSTKLLFSDPAAKQWLDSGYGRAKAVLFSIERRTSAEVRSHVSAAYGEFVSNNQSEVVPQHLEQRSDHATYVLPSRPVIKMDRLKTKVRVIMNASAVTRASSSTLNKLLLQGPNLLPHVPSVVMRFRHRRFIFCLDVRKMFLQVELRDEEDRDMCRYLWRDFNTNSRPIMYRHKVLPFGFVSSPFQAIWCVQETARMFQKQYPLAYDTLLNNLYMDDIIDGADTVEEANAKCLETVKVLELGGFKSHQACANHVGVLRGLEHDQVNNMPSPKVLGHLWLTGTDTLQFDLSKQFPEPDDERMLLITRRVIISYASMIFDTLGLVLPFQMTIRVIIPHLWANDIQWDEHLETSERKNDEIAKEAVAIFRNWCAEVPLLARISVRRFLHNVDGLVRLAVFGDASKMAFGVAVYSISIVRGKPQSNLEFSRARLAPKAFRDKLKGGDVLTIARLELAAMLIGVAAAKYCCDNIGFDMARVVYFTDSLLNLQRIQAGPSACLRWEAARVSSILERSKENQWRFVPGKINPSDIVSRGSTVADLLGKHHQLWYFGPDFLLLPEDKWPQQPIPKSTKDKRQSVEVRKFWDEKSAENIHVHAIEAAVFRVSAEISKLRANLAWLDALFVRVSSFRRITRIVARILWLAQSRRDKSLRRVLDADGVPQLHADLLWKAQLLIIKRAQQQHLPEDYRLAFAKSDDDTLDVDAFSPALRNLDVYMDTDLGLLRKRTRLCHATTLQHDFINPIILPKCNIIAKKVLQLHLDYYHLQKISVFHMLRERFHVVGGAPYIGGIIRECPEPRCRKLKCFETKMEPFPAERLDKPETFKYVSVDLMGPFYVQHTCTETLKFKAAKNALKHRKSDLAKAEQEARLRDLKNFCPHAEVEGLAKVWGCLFVCFHTRAIHLELLRDSSTQQFILALERFIGRRGRPEMIYSDNASNFKSAEKELKQMYRKIDFTAVRNAGIIGARSQPITWQFSTEKAAWTNGITERLVQSVKRALRPTLLREVVSFERLEAILIGIEGILNCRPLALTSAADPDLATPITPSLLMYGKNMMPLEDPPRSLRLDEAHMPDITRSMKVRQRFLNMFWRLWRKEYLLRFEVAKKWVKPRHNKLDIGDIVVIVDPDNLRNDWRLAKVVEPTFSKAKNLIGAKVRTANGKVLTRHLRNLAMLEAGAVFKGDPKPFADQVDAQPDGGSASQVATTSTSTSQSTSEQRKQYPDEDSTSGRPGIDQAAVGRTRGPIGGNDEARDVGGDAAVAEAAAGAAAEAETKRGTKRKRGPRKSRRKFKH